MNDDFDIEDIYYAAREICEWRCAATGKRVTGLTLCIWDDKEKIDGRNLLLFSSKYVKYAAPTATEEDTGVETQAEGSAKEIASTLTEPSSKEVTSTAPSKKGGKEKKPFQPMKSYPHFTPEERSRIEGLLEQAKKNYSSVKVLTTNFENNK